MGQFRSDLDFEGIVRNPYRKTIIYQGALNMSRGIELAIQSMQYVNNAKLQIIGNGDIQDRLVQLVADLRLESKVEFTGRVPMEELWAYTSKADIGISLEEKIGLNYEFALPNKLFDYIQARLPVVVSDLPELSAMVKKYAIGQILSERTPEKLGEVFTKMLEEELPAKKYFTNLEIAAREFCWEREEEKLIRLFKHANTSA